jgi:hypothetical protein
MTRKLRETYDCTIQIGQLITTYHSGFHVLTGIHFRDAEEPLFFYTKVLNEDGTKSLNETNECSSSWCFAVTLQTTQDTLQDELASAKSKFNNTTEYLKGK